MDQHLLHTVFLMEAERQSSFGLMAATDLDDALSRNDQQRIWFSVHALLAAAGNVSKLLWPTSKLRQERGRQLRTSLAVSDDSPLKHRTLRNHFEHFDERLEAWARSTNSGFVVDSNIDLAARIGGVEAGDFLRNLDTQRHLVTFRGESYELHPLVEALADVCEKAAGASRRPRGSP